MATSQLVDSTRKDVLMRQWSI